MTNRIAITGMGVIAPGGAIGREAFAETLREEKCGVTLIERFSTDDAGSHLAGVVTDFKVRDFIPMMKARRMNALSRMGVASANLAIEESGLKNAGLGRDDVGVALGTAFGPMQTSVDYMREYLEKGPAFAPPQLFAESVANAPGSHVAIENGFEGFNVTFTQRESSYLTALMYASQQMMKGVTKAAVCVGVDELNEILFCALARIGALAHERGDLAEMCRPFDAKRNGVVAGEGSTSLVLQNEPDCQAPPLAFLTGVGIARDPSATVSDWGSDPDHGVAAMSRAIEDANLAIGDIDAIFASANGSIRGDRVEAVAIEQLSGTETPVVATKGYFGEYAAAGGLQVAAAITALTEQTLPRSLGFESPEEGCMIPITTARTETPLRHVLVNSFSAGGGIVCVVLSRSDA